MIDVFLSNASVEQWMFMQHERVLVEQLSGVIHLMQLDAMRQKKNGVLHAVEAQPTTHWRFNQWDIEFILPVSWRGAFGYPDIRVNSSGSIEYNGHFCVQKADLHKGIITLNHMGQVSLKNQNDQCPDE